jgi:hypothetical protein
MEEENRMEPNRPGRDDSIEGRIERRRNIVNGLLLALAVLLILGFGIYLAAIAIIKDGF